MSTQVVVAKLEGLTGRAAELRTLLGDRARDVRAEHGCAGYEVAELLDEPASFVIVQTWTSSEALRAHYATEAHAEYQHAVDELLATPSRGRPAPGRIDDAPEREHVADGSRALRLADLLVGVAACRRRTPLRASAELLDRLARARARRS